MLAAIFLQTFMNIYDAASYLILKNDANACI
jgi:hypothetical protein